MGLPLSVTLGSIQIIDAEPECSVEAPIVLGIEFLQTPHQKDRDRYPSVSEVLSRNLNVSWCRLHSSCFFRRSSHKSCTGAGGNGTSHKISSVDRYFFQVDLSFLIQPPAYARVTSAPWNGSHQ